MSKVVCTYHKDCIDGTAAAAVVLKRFPQAELFPLDHSYTGDDIAPVLKEATAGAVLYTVDCGLGAREWLEQGFPVVTIDHHAGAQELFEQLEKEFDNYTYVFDNEKSGASLTWSYLFSDEPEPEIIKFVQDADLWTWKYRDDTRDVNNYLSMFRNSPTGMLELIDGDLEEIKEKGSIITQYANREIENQTKLNHIKLKIGRHEVLGYNITVYQSDAGNQLSEKHNQTVAMFSISGNQVKLSFRSQEGQEPTALELAQSLGGGGHKKASGATISLEDFLKRIVD